MKKYINILVESVLARFFVLILTRLKVSKGDLTYYKYFKYWESKGIHVVPNHFYQPIPDTGELSDKVFDKELPLVNLNFDISSQINLIDKFSAYSKEILTIPKKSTKSGDFHFNNFAFDNLDAIVYYLMIRFFKPKKIIEVGSGWSTKIASIAVARNGKSEFISIEPYPLDFLRKIANLTQLIEKKVELIDKEYFRSLKKNDILFIDTSHVIKTGGDVNYLILEVLPILKKGVLIHIHDIFIPYEYPKWWIKNDYRFWTEQYLLYAFLLFNDSYKIIFSNQYLGLNKTVNLRKIVPNYLESLGGSIWLKKIK
jgi:hypothetical protein